MSEWVNELNKKDAIKNEQSNKNTPLMNYVRSTPAIDVDGGQLAVGISSFCILH